MTPDILNVAFPNNGAISDYDPAKIRYDYQYILLENLYSTLITYSQEGELVSSIAERFEWVGNEVHLIVRNSLKTIDGYEINAKDVEMSLKRLFLLQSNMHGDLKKMLCGNAELKNLEDTCPNLEIKDSHTIVMKFQKKDPFLFSMLTSADFSIIPRRSIDAKALNIIDYRNTSGPYYVEKDNGNGNMALAANPQHYNYSKNMPQKIKLVPSSRTNDSNSSLELFKKGLVDLITTIDTVKPPEIIAYAETQNNTNLFKTIPIQLESIRFTPTGEAKFSVKERFEISALMKKAILPDLLKGKGKEATIQIFPPFGQGTLTREQIQEIETEFNAVKATTFTKKFTAWNLPKDTWIKLKQYFPNAEFKHVRGVPGLVDYKANNLEEPELFFSTCDTSIKEDVSLFSYYMNGYFFSIHGKEGAKWIDNYVATESLETRMKLFNKLHYDTLSKAITIPLTFAPYVAIVRKPWRFNFLTLHAGTTLWRLRCD